MKKEIIRVSLKCLIALIPIYIIIVIYIILDPFRVVHPPDPYFVNNEIMHIGWNKCFVSTENFNRHHGEIHPDYYIFGPSLSIGYKTEEWGKYLQPNSKIYHFDASSESFYGILLKLNYIIKSGEQIKNALFIFDPMIFSRGSEAKSHLYAQHPDLTPQPDYIQFQWKFFKIFLNSDFIIKYLELIKNGYNDDMVNTFNNNKITYSNLTNEESSDSIDSLLEINDDLFYATRHQYFKRNYNSTQKLKSYFTPEIKNKLNEMKKILIAQNCSYKIILPPMYDLKSLSDSDKAILYSIFGHSNITDLSGANEISLNMKSFYDAASHPRPATCAKVLKIAYNKTL